MAFQITKLTEDVRVGINARGELNIEVQQRHPNGQPSEVEEIYVPADALEPLFQYLRTQA